jgi:alkanesulfonate monooxygenase SsuD/methylene tetrahydromethanopterin reductase-like flavin-dependent oxidoreductase (luciferase family)
LPKRRAWSPTYRNPFLVARAVATLDRFSGGRVTLSVGTGYLKGEYRALGVDFSFPQNLDVAAPCVRVKPLNCGFLVELRVREFTT